MVIKNLENKIKLVGIVCGLFLVGCIIISVASIVTARGMVSDAHKKIYEPYRQQQTSSPSIRHMCLRLPVTSVIP